MSNKILDDVIEYVGLQVDESDSVPMAFQSQLLLNTNSELSKLVQLGVIPVDRFTNDATANTVWSDVLIDEARLSMAKTYVKIGVRLVFDPPTSGTLMDALKNEKDECEWRALVAMEEIASEATP